MKILIYVLIYIVGLQSEASDREFMYSSATGTCVNSKGESGMNPIILNELRFNSNTDIILNISKRRVLRNRNFECVDMEGLKFNEYINFGYPVLLNWNFKGANLNNIEFLFARIIDADFSGAVISTKRVFGYASIHGRMDVHTEFDGNCIIQADSSLGCGGYRPESPWILDEHRLEYIEYLRTIEN